MKKILFNLIMYIIIGNLNYVYSQDMKNITNCFLIVNYSEEAEKIKNQIINETEIKKFIEFNIIELNINEYLNFQDKKFILLMIDFNYYKNYEDPNNNQYYGGITIKAFRYLEYIDNPPNIFPCNVFSEETYFVFNNPNKEVVIKEFRDIIYHLIIEFSAQYYKDNQ